MMITFDAIEELVHIFEKIQGRTPKYIILDEPTYDYFFRRLMPPGLLAKEIPFLRSVPSGMISLSWTEGVTVSVIGAKGVSEHMFEAI